MLDFQPSDWARIVERVRRETLASIAAATGISLEELRTELIESSRHLAADRSAWWPEAMRLRDTLSIRAIARLFDTEPRRIRRALARTGVRVAGEDLVTGQGSPRLSAYVDMLGKERDRALAKAAGVIPEAVQGERTRLAIEAYRQRARVRLSRDDEEWIRGPKKLRRERPRTEPETLQVVRRHTRPGDEPYQRREPDTERAPRPEPGFRPPVTDRGFGERRFTERAPFERPFGGDRGFADRAGTAPDGPPARRPSVSPTDFFAESRRRDFFRSDRENDMERLLEPVRQRDGRQRIVRADPARPSAVEEAAPLGVIRRRVSTSDPPRSSPGAADAARADAERPVERAALPATPQPLGAPSIRRPAAPVAAAPLAAAPTDVRPAPVRPLPVQEPLAKEPVREAVRRVVASPVVASPVVASPMVASPVVASPVVASPTPASPGAPSPVATPTPAPVRRGARAQVAVAPAPLPVTTVVAEAQVEWLVFVPGRGDPLVVMASDIASAAARAATLVPATLLARASIWRADGAAPAPDLLG